MMIVKKTKLYLATITACLVSMGTFADFAVIVHPDNTENFSASDIKEIYLGKIKSFDDGEKIDVVNLKPSHNVKEIFDKKILKKSPRQVKAYWAKIVFTGRGMPPSEVESPEKAKELVASNPKAIAYIPLADIDTSVKNVFEFK